MLQGILPFLYLTTLVDPLFLRWACGSHCVYIYIRSNSTLVLKLPHACRYPSEFHSPALSHPAPSHTNSPTRIDLHSGNDLVRWHRQCPSLDWLRLSRRTVAKTLSGVSSRPDGFTLYIEVNSHADLVWLLERVCSAIDVAGLVRSADSAARAVRPGVFHAATTCVNMRTQITKNDEAWPCLACLKRHRVIRSERHSQYLSHGHHKGYRTSKTA